MQSSNFKTHLLLQKQLWSTYSMPGTVLLRLQTFSLTKAIPCLLISLRVKPKA